MSHGTLKKKLLIVDDDASVTRVIARVADILGHDVRAENNPATAFDAFLLFLPDVLTIDLVMPELDGIDILHKILAMGTTARIVVMSGHGQTYLRLGKEVGSFHDFPSITTLAKPFRRADLVALLGPA